MLIKIFLLLSILAINNAIPYWIVNNPVPGAYIVNGLSPNLTPSGAPAFSPVFRYSNPEYALALANTRNLDQSGLAISSSQAKGSYGHAVAATQNDKPALWTSQSALSSTGKRPYESALSSSKSAGLGYGSAIATADSTPGSQSVISLASVKYGPWNNENSIAAAENNGAYKTSIANTVQQNGGLFQKSGANSVNAPGVQAANAHAFKAGF